MKRGESGLCLVLGVDKPTGMSSHDVVNACRNAFGERRVGHTGTLDPLASGALAVCVGPATRLDAFMVGHDKTYDVRISFGAATDTDDALGEVIRTAPVPAQVCDEDFAKSVLARFLGPQKQMPPAYSAIKKAGVKACDAARRGTVIALDARDIEVYSAQLLGLERDANAESIYWDVRFSVSKGTYIRALARDVGVAAGTAAHVERLRRVSAGNLLVEDCLPLDLIAQRGLDAACDPVFLLGYRMAFLSDAQAADVANGKRFRVGDLRLFEAPRRHDDDDCGPCRSAVQVSGELTEGECVSMVHGNDLKAIYAYDGKSAMVCPQCVFSIGVTRGKGL